MFVFPGLKDSIMDAVDAIGSVLLVAYTALAAAWDIRQRRIPNWLALAGAGVAVSYCAIACWNGVDVGQNVLGMILAALSMLLLYLGGGVGGGDVKFMVAFGLLAGYPDIVHYLFYGALTALIIILGRLAWRGELARALAGLARGRPRFFHSSPEERREAGEDISPRSVSFTLSLLLAVVWVWVLAAV